MPRFRRVARDTRRVRPTALAALPSVGSAEEAPATTVDGASCLTLGEVTVSASRTGALSARDGLRSVDILGAERVQDQQVHSA